MVQLCLLNWERERAPRRQRRSNCVDYLNLLYSPATVYKLLHPLYHLREVSIGELNLAHHLNPAIVELLDEWLLDIGNREPANFRLHACTYNLKPDLGNLEHLLRMETGEKWWNGRKRRADGSVGGFVHSHKIAYCEYWDAIITIQQAEWLLSNGGTYCREACVSVKWDRQWRELIVNVSFTILCHHLFPIISHVACLVREAAAERHRFISGTPVALSQQDRSLDRRPYLTGRVPAPVAPIPRRGAPLHTLAVQGALG